MNYTFSSKHNAIDAHEMATSEYNKYGMYSFKLSGKIFHAVSTYEHKLNFINDITRERGINIDLYINVLEHLIGDNFELGGGFNLSKNTVTLVVSLSGTEIMDKNKLKNIMETYGFSYSNMVDLFNKFHGSEEETVKSIKSVAIEVSKNGVENITWFVDVPRGS